MRTIEIGFDAQDSTDCLASGRIEISLSEAAQALIDAQEAYDEVAIDFEYAERALRDATVQLENVRATLKGML